LTSLNSFSNIKLTKRQQLYIVLTSLVCTFFSLLPRLSGDYFEGKYLWAEDSTVFINQAQQLGIQSLITPYAGYLHLFMRLVAYVSNMFSLSSTGNIFLLGWVVAFYIMIHSIIFLLVSLRLPITVSSMVALLVALQPNNGEVFFTLTNAQWILGVAAVVLLATQMHCSISTTSRWLMPVLCLTGPFCLLATPSLAMLQFYRHRGWKRDAWLVIIPFLAIQAMVVIAGTRGAINSLPQDYLIRIKYFLSFVSFGADGWLLFCAAGTAWGAYFYSMRYRTESAESKYRRDLSILFLSIGIISILVTFLPSANPMPFKKFGDFGGGFRYTWVPYSLMFISMSLMTYGSTVPHLIASSMLAIICASHTLEVRWGDKNLEFAAFSRFSKYKFIEIPINPQWSLPSQFVIKDLRKKAPLPVPPQHIKLKIPDTALYGGHAISPSESFIIFSETSDPMVIPNQKLKCTGAKGVGIEIDITRDSDGWLQLFWSPSGEFTEKKSMRRFYQSGKIIAQFAFENFDNGFELRFDPLEKIGIVEISDFRVYCLS